MNFTVLRNQTEDTYINIPIKSNQKYSRRTIEYQDLDQEQLFERERQESNVYRIHGTIEFISPLIDKIKQDTLTVTQLFNKVPDTLFTTFSFDNMFRIYIVEREVIQLTPTSFQNIYTFKTTEFDAKIYKTYISKNIYSEYYYNFLIQKDLETTSNNLLLYITALDNSYQPFQVGDTITGETYNLGSEDTIPSTLTYQINNDNSTPIGILTFDYKKLYPIILYDDNNAKLDLQFTNKTHYYYTNFSFTLLPRLDNIGNLLYNNFIIDITQLTNTFDIANPNEQC